MKFKVFVYISTQKCNSLKTTQLINSKDKIITRALGSVIRHIRRQRLWLSNASNFNKCSKLKLLL